MKITFEVGDIVKLADPEKQARSFFYEENLFKIVGMGETKCRSLPRKI